MLKREVEPLTHLYLTELLDYKEEKGLFMRKRTTSPNAKEGDIVGYKKPNGYMSVSINHNSYLLHRLAWFFINKEWPEVIDHINGIRDDNRIVNLRDTTQQLNSYNRHKYKGFKGVHWCNRQKRYIAKIVVNKSTKHIGTFKCPIEAEKAYLEAKKNRNISCNT